MLTGSCPPPPRVCACACASRRGCRLSTRDDPAGSTRRLRRRGGTRSCGPSLAPWMRTKRRARRRSRMGRRSPRGCVSPPSSLGSFVLHLRLQAGVAAAFCLSLFSFAFGFPSRRAFSLFSLSSAFCFLNMCHEVPCIALFSEPSGEV